MLGNGRTSSLGRRKAAGRAGVLLSTGMAVLVVLAACGGEMNALDPKGSGARRIANLWWLLFGLGTAVFVVVCLLIGIAVFRNRRQTDGPLSTRFVLGGGFVIPFVILSVVFAATIWTMTLIADTAEDDALHVHVIGHQYWWEVRYPDHNIITANEIHIPVGEPVRFTMTGSDVIHSLWVPDLAGKMDLIPGRNTTLWIEAEETGRFRGQCAEFCGIQHANMAFFVVAQEEAEFNAWIENQQLAAVDPDNEILARGQEVYLSTACIYCHRIDGTASNGDLGPDLTHLASRETLASGTLENNRANLGGWIVDPQAIKPGNLMPGVTIEGEDLQALLTYLESLE